LEKKIEIGGDEKRGKYERNAKTESSRKNGQLKR
jgi:hypothetical protein